MSAFLLHVGATVLCAHGGQALPSVPAPRVMVGGQPIVTQPNPYTIAGCAFVPPAGNGPCVSAQWVIASTRIFASNQPIVLQHSQSVCAPTGTPLSIAVTQMRVSGT